MVLNAPSASGTGRIWRSSVWLAHGLGKVWCKVGEMLETQTGTSTLRQILSFCVPGELKCFPSLLPDFLFIEIPVQVLHLPKPCPLHISFRNFTSKWQGWGEIMPGKPAVSRAKVWLICWTCCFYLFISLPCVCVCLCSRRLLWSGGWC